MSDPAAPTAELAALDQAIAALEGQRAVLGDLVAETALAPLIEKRDRLLAASVGEQLKLVTVLFADLVDSTPLAQRLDPEDLQQVMSRYFAAVRSAVEAEGGDESRQARQRLEAPGLAVDSEVHRVTSMLNVGNEGSRPATSRHANRARA